MTRAAFSGTGRALTGRATAISGTGAFFVASLEEVRTISVFAGDFSDFRAMAVAGVFFGGEAGAGDFDFVVLLEATAFLSFELLDVFFVLLATAVFFGAEGGTAFRAGLLSTTILAFGGVVGGAVTARRAAGAGGGAT